MNTDLNILIAEDDDGHASLIQKNLKRAGIANDIHRFRDGREVMDFLLAQKEKRSGQRPPMLLLLDIRMPRMDGVEVLRAIKTDDVLKRMPVIMITTTDDPREVATCHELGCSSYVTKPVDYEKFIRVIRQLGLYLKVVSVPAI